MAKSWDKNTVYATTAAAFYAFKALAKAQGFTVPSSSDGTTYNAAGDQITHGGAGAGGMANSLAWFRLRDPAGVREWLFQRGSTSNHHWWIRYSALARFVGGAPSATVGPTATDSQNHVGTATAGTDCFLGGGGEGTLRFQMMVDSTAPYTWYMYAYSTGGSGTRGWIFCDALQAGSYDAADTDPVVLGFFTQAAEIFTNATSITTIMQSSATPGTPGLFAWIKFGLAGAGYVGMAVSPIYEGSTNFYAPGGAAQNPYSAKDEVFAPMVSRSAVRTAPTGLKGVLQNMRMVGPQHASSGDVINVAGVKDFIVVDKSFAQPWDGTDPLN